MRAPSTVVWVIVAFIAVAASTMLFGAPRGLGGFVLTPSATIAEGSRLPPNAGAVGDRVVAVAGQPTEDLAELRTALAAHAPGESVEVVIERTAAPEARTITPSSFVGATLVDWVAGSVVTSVEGHATPSEGWTLDGLQALSEAVAPTALAVTVQPPPALTRGPVPVHRRGPEPLSVAWLAVTLLVLIGTVVFRYERLDRSSGAPTASLAALASGGIALTGLSEWAVLQTPAPVLVGLSLTGLVFASGWAAASELGGGWRRPSIVLWLVGLTAIVPAAWIALPQMSEHSLLVLALSLAASASAVRAYYAWRRSSGAWVVAIGLLATLLALVAVVSLLAWADRAAGLWLGLVHAATVWASVLPAAVLWADEGQTAWARPSSPTGARALLETLREDAGGAEPMLFVGFGPTWVCLRRPVHASPGSEGLRASLAAPELSSGLGLLAEEGISIPRPALDDDDPLGDWPDKLGLRFAVSLSAPGANPPVLVGMVQSADASGERVSEGVVNVDLCAETVSDTDRDRVASEAVAAAVGLALSQATRRAPGADARGPESREPVRQDLPPVAPSPPVSDAAPAATASSGAQPSDAWNRHLREQIRRRYPVDEPSLIDEREASVLRALAADRAPVLFIGEAGVGKEFMARAMAMVSDESERPFVTLDADAMPPSLVEVALFGADDETGLCELAGEGTVLVKNLSLLPESVLRGVVARLIEQPARIVFTERYHGDEAGVPSTIPEAITRQTGRRSLHLSPLRDRPEDVRRYAQWMLHRASMRHGGEVVDFTTSALDLLAGEAWVLNFPELQLVVERAVVGCDADVVDVQHVRSALRPPGMRDRVAVPSRAAAPAPAPSEHRPEPAADGLSQDEQGERDRILRALDAHDGNRTQAARALGFTRGKLLRRLKKFGID